MWKNLGWQILNVIMPSVFLHRFGKPIANASSRFIIIFYQRVLVDEPKNSLKDEKKKNTGVERLIQVCNY